MLVADVKKLDPAARFVYWITEREAIRKRKEGGKEAPWTDDLILSTYRFCNVRRMDDAVSRWLLKNWYQPYFNHPNMLLVCALARFINEPATLVAIGFPVVWRPQEILTILRRRKRQQERVFNPAYVIPGEKGVADKAESVVMTYVGGLLGPPVVARKSQPFAEARLPEVDTSSMMASWKMLCRYRGWGSFLAGQVVADLRWTVEGEWLDRNTWAPQGPGSTRGLNRLQGRAANTPLSVSQWQQGFREVLALCQQPEKLPLGIRSRVEAMDIQNCLCEFDKYERALWGEGKPKQKYRPKEQPLGLSQRL